MYIEENDIVERHHCIDDDVCPVNDELIERNYYMLTPAQRRIKDDRQKMQAAAIDTYFRILEETGTKAKADEAFRKIHSDFYARN